MFLIALAVLAADPASLNSMLNAAKPGDTLRLVAGRYGPVTIKARTFDPPLAIDASAATVAGVRIYNSTGVRWTGGTFKGDITAGGGNYGFYAVESKAIAVTDVHFSDYRVGIVFDTVNDGAVTGNWLAQMTSDGIDVAASRGIVIAHNACTDFVPGPGAHPDCIQLWSRSDAAPVADISITANNAVGFMQGISLFNTFRGGVDPGGFDRVKITNNTVVNTMGNGIAIISCRGCSVRNNTVNSLPNYIHRAQLYVEGGSVEQCGNDVVMVPRQSTPACRN